MFNHRLYTRWFAGHPATVRGEARPNPGHSEQVMHHHERRYYAAAPHPAGGSRASQPACQ